MNVNFNKNYDGMSLCLDYDAAKASDCAEAARLVEAFCKAVEPKPMSPQAASMLSTLVSGAFSHCGGCKGDNAAADDTADKRNNAEKCDVGENNEPQCEEDK